MKKKKILLVDDEDIILASLGRELGFDLYEVKTASSAEEAMQRYREEGGFDLVVSDFMMPGVNGLELLKWVKAHDPFVAFFILTGYGDAVSTLQILENGADEMLLKPCDTDELLLRIARALQVQGDLRRLREYEESPRLCSACESTLAKGCTPD